MGEKIDKDKLVIKIGDFMVAEIGKISSSYDESKLKNIWLGIINIKEI